MSEDSIASDSISCRTDVSAPLLPPRKRLLAGLKQNGWASPSSSSCAPPPMADLPSTEPLAHTSTTKLDDPDHNFVEVDDRVSLQALHCAAESVDSHHKSQRKSKRHRTSSSLTIKKASNNKIVPSKVKASGADEKVKDFEANLLSVAEVVKDLDSEEVKDEVDMDAIAEAEKASAGSNVSGVANAEGAASVLAPTNPSSTVNEVEEVTHDEAHKPSRNFGIKGKEGEETVVCAGEAQKPSRNVAGNLCNGNQDAGQKKQESRHSRNSKASLPLADEELARQLHRAMNSSPRISRSNSHKEDRPLLSSNRKH